MKRSVWMMPGAIAIILSVVAVIRAGSTRGDDPASRTQVVRVVRRNVESVVKATGVIRPRVGAEVRVGSRISGVVTRLHVQVGDMVKKGQMLATLDDRDLIARRDEAAATFQRAEIEQRYAAIDRARKRELAAAGNLSPSDLDGAEQAASLAGTQVEAARASFAYAVAQADYTH